MSGPISDRTTEEKKREQAEGGSQPDARRSAFHGPEADVLALHDEVGNRAVSGLIQAKLTPNQPDGQSEQGADRMANVAASPSASASPRGLRFTPHAFGGIHSILRKIESGHIKVSQPGDKDEQEADQMADRVMSMTGVSRKTEFHEARDGLARRPNARTSSVLASSRGKPLPEPIRAFFEPRFGADFSSVRIHTDKKASTSAKTVNARAYTIGEDIVFNSGEYSTETMEGKGLLAHELAHITRQQNDQYLYRKPTFKQSSLVDHLGTGDGGILFYPEGVVWVGKKRVDFTDFPNGTTATVKIPPATAGVIQLRMNLKLQTPTRLGPRIEEFEEDEVEGGSFSPRVSYLQNFRASWEFVSDLNGQVSIVSDAIVTVNPPKGRIGTVSFSVPSQGAVNPLMSTERNWVGMNPEVQPESLVSVTIGAFSPAGRFHPISEFFKLHFVGQKPAQTTRPARRLPATAVGSQGSRAG